MRRGKKKRREKSRGRKLLGGFFHLAAPIPPSHEKEYFVNFVRYGRPDKNSLHPENLRLLNFFFLPKETLRIGILKGI